MMILAQRTHSFFHVCIHFKGLCAALQNLWENNKPTVEDLNFYLEALRVVQQGLWKWLQGDLSWLSLPPVTPLKVKYPSSKKLFNNARFEEYRVAISFHTAILLSAELLEDPVDKLISAIRVCQLINCLQPSKSKLLAFNYLAFRSLFWVGLVIGQLQHSEPCS